MKFQYDKNNVPVLSKPQIEDIANRFLKAFSPESLNKPKKLNWDDIIESLEERELVKFDFTKKLSIGVLGKIQLETKIIYIDKNLAETPDLSLFNFTISHEVAHFALHTKKRIKEDGKPRTSLSDKQEHFFLGGSSKELKSVRDWVEFQANYFAASLIMPTNVFKNALKKLQIDMGINRNVGKIFLDKQPSSKSDYDTIVKTLGETFNASKSSIKIRLYELGLVDDRSEKSLYDVKHISQIISGSKGRTTFTKW